MAHEHLTETIFGAGCTHFNFNFIGFSLMTDLTEDNSALTIWATVTICVLIFAKLDMYAMNLEVYPGNERSK